jgi:hypothetical protein
VTQEDGATLFHCHTGKDRTGLVAAVILTLLGVDEEDVIADYMMSTPYVEPMLEYLAAKGQPVGPERLWLAVEPPVEAGMRVDVQTYDGSDDGEQWSPRVSLLYSLSPRTKLRAGWGRFYQSHAINELQVEDGISQFYPAQHADHVIASLEHAFHAGFDLRVEAYRKDYRRIHPRYENLFDPVVLFPEAEFDRV